LVCRRLAHSNGKQGKAGGERGESNELLPLIVRVLAPCDPPAHAGNVLRPHLPSFPSLTHLTGRSSGGWTLTSSISEDLPLPPSILPRPFFGRNSLGSLGRFPGNNSLSAHSGRVVRPSPAGLCFALSAARSVGIFSSTGPGLSFGSDRALRLARARNPCEQNANDKKFNLSYTRKIAAYKKRGLASTSWGQGG
jgi:hypothetical protein